MRMDVEERLHGLDEEAEIVKVLKELFDEKKVEMISELSDDELRLITAMLVTSSQLKIPILSVVATKFMKLRLSTNRKSRHELLEAVKGYMAERRYGFMDKFRGMLTR